MIIVSDPILERIRREAGAPELIDVLAERLSPSDLKSLLLEVYRRRAIGFKPSQLLERYEQDRFVRPTDLAPRVTTNFDSLVWSITLMSSASLTPNGKPVVGTMLVLASISTPRTWLRLSSN